MLFLKLNHYFCIQTPYNMKHTIDDLHVFTLHAGYAEHKGDWNWKNVRSPFARLYYVTEGEAQIIIHSSASQDEEIINLRPNHLYLVPPFTLHSNVCNSIFKHYYIHMLEGTSDKFHYLYEYRYKKELPASAIDLQLFQTLSSINHFLSLPESNPEAYNNTKSLMRNVDLGKQRPLCDKVESRGILYILLSRFLRSATPIRHINDERIERAIEYIDTNIARPISIDDITQIVSMSKDHFIRKFRKETGLTPVAYTTRRKIEMAETLLVTTEHPIKYIASKLGYEDTAYFYRIFKKHVGKSPQKYREENS